RHQQYNCDVYGALRLRFCGSPKNRAASYIGFQPKFEAESSKITVEHSFHCRRPAACPKQSPVSLPCRAISTPTANGLRSWEQRLCSSGDLSNSMQLTA